MRPVDIQALSRAQLSFMLPALAARRGRTGLGGRRVGHLDVNVVLKGREALLLLGGPDGHDVGINKELRHVADHARHHQKAAPPHVLHGQLL